MAEVMIYLAGGEKVGGGGKPTPVIQLVLLSGDILGRAVILLFNSSY